MSWLCNIKHKWVYGVENITLLQGVYTKYLVTKPTNVRFCERCCKKQKSRWSSVDSLKELTSSDWVDSELTVDEKREYKLKQVLR
jgi:hypothetical protein